VENYDDVNAVIEKEKYRQAFIAFTTGAYTLKCLWENFVSKNAVSNIQSRPSNPILSRKCMEIQRDLCDRLKEKK
jgi:hypothetical protein